MPLIVPGITPHDLHIWTLTVAGEARGSTADGRVAVAWVPVHRWRRPGWWTRHPDPTPDDTIAAASVEPSQFSCWNAGDPNLRYIATLPATHPDYLEARLAVLEVLTGRRRDPVQGSCHYHAEGAWPRWAEGHHAVVAIGAHRFYNDID